LGVGVVRGSLWGSVAPFLNCSQSVGLEGVARGRSRVWEVDFCFVEAEMKRIWLLLLNMILIKLAPVVPTLVELKPFLLVLGLVHVRVHGFIDHVGQCDDCGDYLKREENCRAHIILQHRVQIDSYNNFNHLSSLMYSAQTASTFSFNSFAKNLLCNSN